jgi:hypothetical protein
VILTGIMAIFQTNVGIFSIDEAVQQKQIMSLLQAGEFAVSNGYEIYPSPMLTLAVLLPKSGLLMSQYPPFYAVLASPFYWALGLQGLVVLNALAFMASVFFLYRFAMLLSADRTLAIDACLVFALATYIWEYALGVWPHAVSVFLIVLASYFVVLAGHRATASSRALLSLVGGVTVGLVVGVRLDSIFVLPGLGLAILLLPPARALRLASFAVGLLAVLLLLSAINDVRFGEFSPLTYGRVGGNLNLLTYLPLLLPGLALWGLLAFFGQAKGRRWMASHARVCAIAAVLVIGGALLVEPMRTMLWRLFSGAWTILVDLRSLPLGGEAPGQLRSPDGGVYYATALKKALLQSCPYLVLGLLPLITERKKPGYEHIIWLFVVVAGFLGIFSYMRWHGGMAFNMRYLLGALPFAAILVAYALRELRQSISAGRNWAELAAGLIMLLAILAVLVAHGTPLVLERFLSVTPLLLAAAMALAALYVLIGPRRQGSAAARTTRVLAVMGLVWAAAMGLGYDFFASQKVRAFHYKLGALAAEVVPPDSLVIAVHPSFFFGLIGQDVVLADPGIDEFESFEALAVNYLASGRRAFASIPDAELSRLERSGGSACLSLRPLEADPFLSLYELVRTEAPCDHLIGATPPASDLGAVAAPQRSNTSAAARPSASRKAILGRPSLSASMT